MKRLLALSLTALIFAGCSKYGYVSLKYPTAPNAVLPENIHSIALVNRSLVKKENKQNNIFEAVTTGEIAGSDKLASDECLKGVFDRINGWRDLTVQIPATTRLYGTGTRETPELLDWQVVQAICDSAHADALLVLENFDSNSDIILANVVNTISAVTNGVPPPPPAHQVRMNVQAFWRLYDPSSKRIVDQYQSNSYLVFDGGGSNFAIPPPEALPQTAYAAGQQYIERFLPGYYYVKRDMYKRGKGSEKYEFLAAFRKSEVADWQGAAEMWTQLAKSRNRRNASRACLNMAVANEVLGKNAEALLWARKSWEEYGNKIARNYCNQLRYRQNVE